MYTKHKIYVIYLSRHEAGIKEIIYFLMVTHDNVKKKTSYLKIDIPE